MTGLNPSPERDLELIAGVARGDEPAFDELVARHQRRVLNTIHRYVGEYDAADDIAQEVFVIVWNKAGTFKGRSSFATWLYRIVVNQCLQFRRKRQRRPAVSLEAFDPDKPPEPLQVAADHEQAARVAAVRKSSRRPQARTIAPRVLMRTATQSLVCFMPSA